MIVFVTHLDDQATSFTYSQANANEMLFFVTEKSSGGVGITVDGNAATALGDVTIGAGTHMQLFAYFSATAGSRSVASSGTPDNIGLSSYTGMSKNSVLNITTLSGQSGTTMAMSQTQLRSGGWQLSAILTDFGRSISSNGNFTVRSEAENASILDTNGVISTGSYTGTYVSSNGGSRQYAGITVEVRPSSTIEFDNAVDGTTNASFSLTNNGNFVVAWVRGGVGEGDNKSATYNGVPMTKLGYGVMSGDRSMTAFYLLAAPTGSNTVAFSGGTINRTGAASYFGVGGLDAGPVSNTATSASSFSISATVVNANSWLIGELSAVTGTLAGASGDAIRVNSTDSCSVDSNGPVGSGSQALGITNGSSTNYAGSMGSFYPTGGAVSSGAFFGAAAQM